MTSLAEVAGIVVASGVASLAGWYMRVCVDRAVAPKKGVDVVGPRAGGPYRTLLDVVAEDVSPVLLPVLVPFNSLHRCPKCSTPDINGTFVRTINGEPYECLAHRCRCGYSWFSECADASSEQGAS